MPHTIVRIVTHEGKVKYYASKTTGFTDNINKAKVFTQKRHASAHVSANRFKYNKFARVEFIPVDIVPRSTVEG